MQVIAEIRRRHFVNKESISAIARDLKLSRPTVHKHLAAVRQSKMCHLDGLFDAVNLYLFLAPIKLAGITGGKLQWDKRLFDAGFCVACLPLFDKALHAVVSTLVTLYL